MLKKVTIGLAVFALLFIGIFGTLSYKKVYPYYHAFPWLEPKGTILFRSNRGPGDEYCMAILKNGKISSYKGGIRARFIKNTGGIISWDGPQTYLLLISDENFANIKPLSFIAKYQPSKFDISPDSKQICFVSTYPQGKDAKHSIWNLFVINIDGTGLKQLTFLDKPFDLTAGTPRWSPDGKTIAFEYVDEPDLELVPGGRNSRITVYSIKPDGTDLKNLIGDKIPDTGDRLDPAWSPEGNKITFVTHDMKNWSYNVFMMNSDGTNIERLTELPYNLRKPVFSPDGSQICFVGYPNGNLMGGGLLFVVDVKTHQIYRVTKSARVKAWPGLANDDDPDWRE